MMPIGSKLPSIDDSLNYDPLFPSVEDLKRKARSRIPKFAFDYLEGGCNDEINLAKNENDLTKIELRPQYLNSFSNVNMSTNVFGQTYDAPFGVSPVGLQGIIWPNSPEILAKAASHHNIPFILSTVTTASIEKVAEITEGKFWFQLYHPRQDALRNDLINRLSEVNCPVLTLLADVPSFGFRYREIKAGLSMPPRLTLKNVLQASCKPTWSLATLRRGIPRFATLEKYMDSSLNIRQLGVFMNQTFNGRIDIEKVSAIRDKWKGKLVLKGITSEQDVSECIKIGVDGIIVSNHGGRQIDVGESSIQSTQYLAARFGNQIVLMMDGGVRSGPDVARAIACGAKLVFMGRPFMYGVAALGNSGGDHTIALFKSQFKQVMEQLSCENVADISQTLIHH